MWGGSDAVLLYAKEKAMAKIEVVKITHTYIIRREGEEVGETPEPVVKMHTRSALDSQGLFRIDERGRYVKVDEPHT